ncbi:MAG: GGDEF domain-containing protein, partial [Deefgea sp.]
YRLQQQWPQALQQLEAAASAVDEADVQVLHLAILQIYLQLPTTEGLAGALERAKTAQASLPANHLHEALLLAMARCCERLAHYAEAAAFYQSFIALQSEQKKTIKTPRRLMSIELKLQQTISEIEIDVLRNKNAQQIEQVKRLESATYRDTLTGLHNLRYLQARWDELLTQAQQTQALCVIHMGVDQSTHLRDVMGDEVANESALRIANLLRRCCPDEGVLVAANNSEFRLIWPTARKTQVAQLIEDIQYEVALLDCSQLPEALTVSFGCTVFQDGDRVDVLQLRADLALYLAMRRGAGAVVWEDQV